MIRISVGGRELPCRTTMGALLRFKRETGRDVTEMDGGVSDTVTFLWCCVASACAADGVDFGLTLEQFADQVLPDDMAAWTASQQADTAASDEKAKKKRR